MTRITDRRLFLAILAALHFVAAPCVMAMTTAAGSEPCEHCDTSRDIVPCATTATDPGNDDGAPAPGRYRPPEPPGVIVLLPAMPVVLVGRSPAGPAERIGRETGRHTGDPPFNVLYGKFLN
ncbi:MAG: hypothetical protein JNK40_01405 [Chromatiales bacterium]|nr:hypothetical protein [Chromatiales bacterium]